VAPGEAILVDESGNFHSRQCAENPQLNPCIFEFVYLARPDSVIDGISVYESRRNLGKSLADKIMRLGLRDEIDVVVPIPDSSRPSAQEVADKLKKPYREGFIKNRYIGRTFIMPGQEMRKKSVRQKLNAMAIEFKDKNVLLVDDSIVRGTTSREIVQMARESGAKKVFFASAAPPVRYPNVYGIDMPSKSELIATGRDEREIAAIIGADAVIYQDLEALVQAVGSLNPAIKRFDCSCFDGVYVTGDVSQEYLDGIEAGRRDGESSPSSRLSSYQLDLGLSRVD
jgi:amidophosphoribosyltransferase